MSLVAAAVGLRVAASDLVQDTAAGVATHPRHALATAFDGWSTSGSLGLPTAEGIRSLPLAVYYRLGELADISVQPLQAGLRALVLVLAVVGAVRLARATAGHAKEGAAPWTPWVAAALFACSPIVVATTTATPLDGLAAASAPWVLAPLVSRSSGWRPAARSALWLGIAGFGSTVWAASVLLAGVLAAAPRRHRDIPQFGRWIIVSLLSSGWWMALAAWESTYGRDVSALLSVPDWGDGVAAAIGRPDLSTPVVAVVAVGPAVVVLSALLLRAPGLDRVLTLGLLLVAVVGGMSVLAPFWTLEVYAHGGAWSPGPALAPFLGLVALAALVSWCPLMEHLATVWGGSPTHARADSRSAVTAVAALLVVVVANVGGVLLAAQERPDTESGGEHPLREGLRAWSDAVERGRALVLPAADDAVDVGLFSTSLQARPWVARTSLPSSGPGATAALDDVVGRLQRGHGTDGTAEGLRRLGISYVIVSSDPTQDQAVTDRNALTRAALNELGASRTAVLGTDSVTADERLQDFGLRPSTLQLEIWSLPSSSDTWSYDRVPLDVKGDIGSVTDMTDADVLGPRPVRLWADDADVPAVVSDSARRRDVDQRVVEDPFGPTLTAREEPTLVPPDAAPRQTAVRRVLGARSVTASSSAADLDGEDRRVGSHRLAAVDGNQFTAWESRRGTSVGEWWEIRFRRPTELADATATFVNDAFRGHTVTRVRLDTDQESAVREVSPGQPLRLELPGRARRLRITVTEVSRLTGPRDNVGIAEIAIPGPSVRDSLVVTGAPASGWVLSTLPGSDRSCVPVAGGRVGVPGTQIACDRGVSVPGFESGDLNRVLRSEEAGRMTGRLWVRAAQSDVAAGLADALAQPTVRATASSVASPDLATRPQSAADGAEDTAWRPSPEDRTPTFRLDWEEAAVVRGVELDLMPGSIASVPTEARVKMDDVLPVTAPIGPDGTIVVPPTRTRSVAVTFLEDSDLRSVDSATGGERHAPMAIVETRLVGGPTVTSEMDRRHDLGCGSGPALSVGGDDIATEVRLSARDILEGHVVQARACSEVDVPVGDVEVVVPASFRWSPLGVVLSAAHADLGRVDGTTRPSSARLPLVTSALSDPGRGHRVAVPRSSSGTRTLVIASPADSGWTAHADGARLEPVTLDGWAQGWLVPAGVERAVLVYSPGVVLRWGAGSGAVALLLVVLMAGLGPSWRRSEAEPGA